jgi:hypothetical protein
MFEMDCHRSDNVIVGGDLNFRIWRGEMCGKDSKPASLKNLFIHDCEEVNCCDVEPIKLTPTWRNKRLGDDNISKRLEKVLVFDQIMSRTVKVRSWVGQGGFSICSPIFLQMENDDHKP